jgi:heme exporter protein C
MIWGHSAWGQWWTWSPRLTFSLVLWLLYVVYVMIRASIESPQRRALISAVYGTIAFLDVPLVWLSVRLMPDIHPTSIALAWPMKLTLIAWFVPVILLSAG